MESSSSALHKYILNAISTSKMYIKKYAMDFKGHQFMAVLPQEAIIYSYRTSSYIHMETDTLGHQINK